MLRLKRVELQGFKSFCDRTELRFNGAGLAAIVGPNGCGKSNISDAISWVLGEQSAKSLRGARMQDVIFAGTAARKPVGMASVTVTLVDPAYHQPLPSAPSNGTGTFPPDAADSKPREITITRRLYRSGESEYLIGGRPARLRDIQELFMGTGLGPDSYAILEQGRIGQILSSRPQDRRALIEEAAGVSKFKARKRLAEAKLESARQNLARVFDILEEVGRQVNSLKRQAGKAERYKKLHAAMIEQLRRVLLGRYRLLERDAAAVALHLNQAQADWRRLSADVAEREKEQSAARQQAFELESRLTQTRARLSELHLEIERTRSRLESQTHQIAEIELRHTQSQTESASLETRCAAIDQQLEALSRLLAELDQHTEAARATLAAKAQEREQAQHQVRLHQEALENGRKAVLRLLGEAAQLNNELAQIDEYIASIRRDSARAAKEQQTAAEELERFAARCAELSAALQTRQSELNAVAARRREIEQALNARKARLNDLRGKLDTLRAETSALKARKDSLDEILSHRAYTTESVKRLFTALSHHPKRDFSPLGVLADFLEVDPEYEKAAEEFLHDELEYVVVKDWAQADAGIELLRHELDGRATFLVHPGADPVSPLSAQLPFGPETGLAAPLSSVLRFTNGLTQAPAELVPRIARCFLVESHQAARRLAPQYPHFYFLLADGVCYHAYSVTGGKKSGSGPLALKRELRELTSLVQSRQGQLDELARQAAALEREIATGAEQLESLRAEQQTREKEVLALEHELRKSNDERARAAQRSSLAQDELERLGRENDRATRQRRDFAAGVEAKQRECAARELALEETRARLDEFQLLAGRLSEEHAALRVELAGREERRRAEHNARAQLEARKRELLARRAELASEIERLSLERARLLHSNTELEARTVELSHQVSVTEESVRELQSEESRLRQALTTLEETLKQLRLQAHQAQEKRAQIEVSLAEKRAELRYLDETARKELNASLAELPQTDQQTLDELALADAEDRYNHLKARIEALGPVNPAALEEYEEAQQRYDFLNAQRQDLLDSIRDTEKAIREIDAETRKRFSHAFQAINENFGLTFRTLFGGGTGEMRLTDPDNLAESGIDLVASPPGKRLQNVLLLSGGEKALTALALLIAIFQFQPSPFCVLDEVDAPLDEANIQRLLRLLKQMAGQTQFIIITHAKTTMEAAEALYGVTMQEPGVSKLVSVKFTPPPEPVPAAQPEPVPV